MLTYYLRYYLQKRRPRKHCHIIIIVIIIIVIVIIVDCLQTDISTNIWFFIGFWGKAFLDKAQHSLGSMFTEFNWMCLSAEQRHQREAEGKPSLPSVMASIFMLLLSWTSRSNTKCLFFLRPPRLSTTSVLYGKGINWTAGESSFQSELSNAVVGG